MVQVEIITIGDELLLADALIENNLTLSRYFRDCWSGRRIRRKTSRHCVWIAACFQEQCVARKFQFGTNRENNIQRLTNMALLLLLQLITSSKNKKV